MVACQVMWVTVLHSDAIVVAVFVHHDALVDTFKHKGASLLLHAYGVGGDAVDKYFALFQNHVELRRVVSGVLFLAQVDDIVELDHLR